MTRDPLARLSAYYSLLTIKRLGKVPLRGAALAVAMARDERGVYASPDTISKQIKWMIEEGFLEVRSEEGHLVLYVTEKGEEVLREVFGFGVGRGDAECATRS